MQRNSCLIQNEARNEPRKEAPIDTLRRTSWNLFGYFLNSLQDWRAGDHALVPGGLLIFSQCYVLNDSAVAEGFFTDGEGCGHLLAILVGNSALHARDNQPQQL